jgi:hypothetical protein
MKLYTEEQVRKMLEVCILSDKYPDVLTLNDVVKTQTPIQLPSDEEIYEQAKSQSTFAPSFIYGAEWMRNKIIGGKNER